MYKWLIILLLIPSVFALNITDDIYLDAPTPYGGKIDIMNPICKEEYNKFIGQQPIDIIKQYCTGLGFKALNLIIIGMFMWLAEPFIIRLLRRYEFDNNFFSTDDLIRMYKAIGLGILFISCWVLFLIN